mgnify:CR=1 FL=1
MKTYQKTHNEFFLCCAYLRHEYGMQILSIDQVEKWLSDSEIYDFTMAYMAGGEI